MFTLSYAEVLRDVRAVSRPTVSAVALIGLLTGISLAAARPANATDEKKYGCEGNNKCTTGTYTYCVVSCDDNGCTCNQGNEE
jgi:hypothetical protein